MLVRPALRLARSRRPAPFSKEWVEARAAPAPRRPAPSLPAWVPEERRLAAAVVLLLAAGAALAGR